MFKGINSGDDVRRTYSSQRGICMKENSGMTDILSELPQIKLPLR